MTVRVTTLKGANAGRYYVDHLPTYYLAGDEPPGRWHGKAATQLGLRGDVKDSDLLRVLNGEDPRSETVHLLGRPYDERSVRAFDITASAPKSVSLLYAFGDDHTRGAVLAGHDAAVAATIDWIEAHAHTRRRIYGQVAVVDAEGVMAAAFRQHTSRANDPQLHTHIVVANRVRSDDGRWLALDARTIKLDQRTLSAIYHASLRAELTGRLGTAWETPVNGIAEIAAAPDKLLGAFSTRTAAITDRLDTKLDRFSATFDREPTRRERWRLEREAAMDSRPPKPHETDATSLRRAWHDRLDRLGITPRQLQRQLTGRSAGEPLDQARLEHVVKTALDSLSAKQSTWRPAEITRELGAALPTNFAASAREVTALLDQLTDVVIERHCVDLSRPVPDAPLRRDRRPITEAATDRALTTEAILAQEHALLAWAERRLRNVAIPNPDVLDHAAMPLTGPQAETAAAIAGTGDLVLVVGPAGTGKTTALAPAVDQLRAEGRPVFGVAPSAVAAEVLTVETGISADTIDKLLHEHARGRQPEPRYRLPAGTTVIVDEAGMVATPHLARLARLADANGWRIALVGDPRQFSAIGRGGMFELLVDTCGAIELDQVHRFTNEWERDASLRLRRGDPSVIDVYAHHDRLHGNDHAFDDAIAAWWEARSAGLVVALCAPTNELVVDLNQAAQRRRIESGDLDPKRGHVDAGHYCFHVGDEVTTRRNDRTLRTDRHLAVHNRDQWRINAIHRDGDLTVNGASGTVRLSADYVARDVELGYASTGHATQGRTVDQSILYLHEPTDIRGIYVPLTRGRHRNDVYVHTIDGTTAHDVVAESLNRSWIDRPAHVRREELNPTTPATTPMVLSGEQLRMLYNELATNRQDLRQLEHRSHAAAMARLDAGADRSKAHEQLRQATRRASRCLPSLMLSASAPTTRIMRSYGTRPRPQSRSTVPPSRWTSLTTPRSASATTWWPTAIAGCMTRSCPSRRATYASAGDAPVCRPSLRSGLPSCGALAG